MPVEALYRDRLTDEQAQATGGDLPCVIAETSSGLVKVLSRDDIEGAGGNVRRFATMLEAAIQAASVTQVA